MLDELIKQLPTATPFFVLVGGFLIGLLHAFEPDHVITIATQNSKLSQKKSLSLFQRLSSGAIKSSFLGELWGVGHTSSLVLFSFLIFVLSMNIPIEIFDNFEIGVGLMLVALGFFTYRNRKSVGEIHIHNHTHDGFTHTHPHVHDKSHNHGHKSYIIGCIHGLAGSGSIVVLTLSTIHDLQTILSFVLVFGIGSIVGMILISSVIGLPFSLTLYSKRINKIIRYSVGTLSIIIGIDILYNIFTHGNYFGLSFT